MAFEERIQQAMGQLVYQALQLSQANEQQAAQIAALEDELAQLRALALDRDAPAMGD